MAERGRVNPKGKFADPERDARAKLDALRHEAGGALSGAEVRRAHGLDAGEAQDDPPLDYRMTPGNLLWQALAVVGFGVVVLFLGWLVWDGVQGIFAHLR